MASLNKALIIGNLTADPEVKYMSNGDAVANITVATNEKWKGKDGTLHEEVEYHDVTLYRRLAEIADEYLKKGSPVYIEGKTKTRKFTDKNGIERKTKEIIANDMKMLGGGSKTQSQPRQQPPTGFDDMGDDIPPF